MIYCGEERMKEAIFTGNQGKAFNLTNDLNHIVDAYTAMDERHSIEALVNHLPWSTALGCGSGCADTSTCVRGHVEDIPWRATWAVVRRASPSDCGSYAPEVFDDRKLTMIAGASVGHGLGSCGQTPELASTSS
jgi:hypothetical protein